MEDGHYAAVMTVGVAASHFVAGYCPRSLCDRTAQEGVVGGALRNLGNDDGGAASSDNGGFDGGEQLSPRGAFRNPPSSPLLGCSFPTRGI